MAFRFFFLSILLSLAVHRTDALCLLCSGGAAGLTHPNYVIDTRGTTCAKHSVDIASQLSENTLECQDEIHRWRETCCGQAEPRDQQVYIPPPAKPHYEHIGPNNVCEICRGGDYPSAKGMVINMLYIGVGTCTYYYQLGQQGLLQDYLCSPLQFFAYEPCGCGEYNTDLMDVPALAPPYQAPNMNAQPQVNPNTPSLPRTQKTPIYDGKDSLGNARGYGGMGMGGGGGGHRD